MEGVLILEAGVQGHFYAASELSKINNAFSIFQYHLNIQAQLQFAQIAMTYASYLMSCTIGTQCKHNYKT